MIYKVIFLLLISLELFSLTLKETYYVNSSNIKLLDIAPDAKYDVTLYRIQKGRYTKRVKTKDLLKVLQKHDLASIITSSRYVKFILKSPIDISQIEQKLQKTYLQKYPNMIINSISVTPRGYIKYISDKYEINIKNRSYLSHSGTLNIKTIENKKIFFDYTIDAHLEVYVSKESIKKGEQLSLRNTAKKNIKFEKFRALPIDVNNINKTQVKRHTKKDLILTLKDIESLNLVKKGSNVNVTLNNQSITISFTAKALQNGKLNDIITVIKSDSKKIQVNIIGKNRVEIR